MKEILKIENIEKYYGNKNNLVKAVDDISFTVKEGEFVGVMGPSGSGKSTLLNVVSTIDTVSGGNIFLKGRNMTEISKKDIAKFRRENLGFVFQDCNLMDTLTIRENIELALTINKKDKELIKERTLKVAKELDIEEILDKYPCEVSGGQKQRGACARAIVNKPKMIMADEPTGALDSKSAQMLINSMHHMNEELGATILMVTHDSFTASHCGRILFIKDGKIFTEIVRGEKSRREFFNEILDVVAVLGGDVRDVR